VKLHRVEKLEEERGEFGSPKKVTQQREFLANASIMRNCHLLLEYSLGWITTVFAN